MQCDESYLTTVVQNKHFAVLERRHGSGIGVEVWICTPATAKAVQKRHHLPEHPTHKTQESEVSTALARSTYMRVAKRVSKIISSMRTSVTAIRHVSIAEKPAVNQVRGKS